MEILAEKLTSKYPVIAEMYFNYLNEAEYITLPFQKEQEGKADEHIDKALQYCQSGEKGKAVDCLLSAAVDYELSGFILGFTYAYNILIEMERVKDFIQSDKKA